MTTSKSSEPFRRTNPWRMLPWFVVLALGCSEDASRSPLDPGPHEGTDEIVFNVYRTGQSGEERLAWRGTVDGPLPDSPESTPIPWVGYLQAFRVEWEADSADAPIVGTRIRASNVASAAFFAIDPYGDGTWGTGNSFSFANAIPPIELVGEDCPSGPDCPDRVRFAAGACSLRILAIDRDGGLLDASLGRLQYRVNFAPQAQWVVDDSDPDAAPHWTALGADGFSVVRGAIAPGDTLPSGVRLHLRLRGRDRVYGSVDPDSACCDQRLDPLVPVVRHQARTYLEQRISTSVLETRQTIFGALAPDSIFSVLVGPFDYRLGGRVADEHGTRSAEEEFSFVAGLRPGRPTMQPAAGEQFELLPPDRPVPIGPDGPRYEVVPAQRRWDSGGKDWVTFGDGLLMSGHFYRIGMILRADPHPRVQLLSAAQATGVTDHVRAFAYELVGEFDPSNRRINGRSDLITNFLDARSLGRLDLTGEDGYQVFVPQAFWSDPQWFAPDIVGEDTCTPGLETFCEMGDRIREDLGRFTFRAVARTTAWDSELSVLPPLTADSTSVDIPLELARFGRRSDVAEQVFGVRLLVQVQGQPEPVLWPPMP